MTGLIRKAEDHIVLIDGYVDVTTLNILAKKNAQYPGLEVKRTTAFHDRFLIIDHKQGYHVGASIKDAGKNVLGSTGLRIWA